MTTPLQALPLPEAPAVSCAMIQCVGTLAGPTAGHDVAGDRIHHADIV